MPRRSVPIRWQVRRVELALLRCGRKLLGRLGLGSPSPRRAERTAQPSHPPRPPMPTQEGLPKPAISPTDRNPSDAALLRARSVGQASERGMINIPCMSSPSCSSRSTANRNDNERSGCADGQAKPRGNPQRPHTRTLRNRNPTKPTPTRTKRHERLVSRGCQCLLWLHAGFHLPLG